MLVSFAGNKLLGFPLGGLAFDGHRGMVRLDFTLTFFTIGAGNTLPTSS